MPLERVPKRPWTPSPQYLNMYGENHWKWLTNQPPNRSYKARCAWCRRGGILGYTIRHRGGLRRTNLLCDDCYHDN